MTRHLPKKGRSGVHTHPGLPFPHGLSQLGSPGLDAFHRAKSLHQGPNEYHFSGWVLENEGMLVEQGTSPHVRTC